VTAGNRQRLDKWLWFARIVKTRDAAATLIEAGHVRLNRNKVTKPAHDVKPGDVLTIVLHSGVRVLKVEGLAPRRGPASAARLLYREPDAPRTDAANAQKEDASAAGNC